MARASCVAAASVSDGARSSLSPGLAKFCIVIAVTYLLQVTLNTDKATVYVLAGQRDPPVPSVSGDTDSLRGKLYQSLLSTTYIVSLCLEKI